MPQRAFWTTLKASFLTLVGDLEIVQSMPTDFLFVAEDRHVSSPCSSPG